MIRIKCKDIFLEYLLKNRGSKGKEIIYTEIQTDEYLLPNNEITIEKQGKIFAIRHRMIDIPANFIAKEKNYNKCFCNEIEEMKHIYECKFLNKRSPDIKFEHIYHGTISERKKILKRFGKT